MRVGRRTVFTRGRPPWYNCEGQIDQCFVVGICGGSGSGKTTVAQRIIEKLNVSWVSLLSMDSYYKVFLFVCNLTTKPVLIFKYYYFWHIICIHSVTSYDPSD